MTEIDREHCRSAALDLREMNDCSVRACAVAAQIDYPGMHEYLAAYGREPRKGFSPAYYLQALRDLGFKVTRLDGPHMGYNEILVEGCWRYNWRAGREYFVHPHYRHTRIVTAPGKDYQARTVKTLARELTTGTYIVGVRGHVLCLRDGVVHDWTDGRYHRIETVDRVEEAS